MYVSCINTHGVESMNFYWIVGQGIWLMKRNTVGSILSLGVSKTDHWTLFSCASVKLILKAEDKSVWLRQYRTSMKSGLYISFLLGNLNLKYDYILPVKWWHITVVFVSNEEIRHSQCKYKV